MDFFKKILVLLLIVSTFIAISSAFFRFKVDMENIAVEVLMDLDDVMEMALATDMNMDEVFGLIKKAGVTSILVPLYNPYNWVSANIAQASLKVIPLIEADGPIDQAQVEAAISTLRSQRGIRLVLALKEWQNLNIDSIQNYIECSNRENVWFLLIGPENRDLERKLGDRIRYRYMRTLEVPLLKLAESSEIQGALKEKLKRSDSRVLHITLTRGDMNITDFLEKVDSLMALLATQGFYTHSEMHFKGVELDLLSRLGMTAGVLAGLLLFSENIFLLSTKTKYSLLVFGLLVLEGVMIMIDSFVLRKVIALISFTVFPAIGLASQFRVGRLISLQTRRPEPKTLFKDVFLTLRGALRMCIISVAGGLIGGCFVGNTPFIKGAYLPFIGAEAYIPIIFLMLIIYLNRFIREDDESLGDFLIRLGNMSLKPRNILLGFIGLIVLWSLYAIFCYQKASNVVLLKLPFSIDYGIILGITFYFLSAYLGSHGHTKGLFFLTFLATSVGFTSLAMLFSRTIFPIVIIITDVWWNLIIGLSLGVVTLLCFVFVQLVKDSKGTIEDWSEPYA